MPVKNRSTAVIFSWLLVAALFLQLAGVNNADAAKRVAFVVGNSDYAHATKLKNPANDAEDISKVLRRLDFQVVTGLDLTGNELRGAIREFSRALDGADVALLFYAGHALQVGGTNYILPIDSNIENKSDLDFETISLNFVMRQMEREAKTILVFLDACRDNPFTRSLARSANRSSEETGLARPASSVEGTYIAFATEPDNVALDGEGRNSPFTKALLEHIEKPNVEISSLMTRVRRDVFNATDKKQLPFSNSGLLGEFYFNPQAGNTTANDELARLKAEAEDWQKVAASNSKESILDFIIKYPEGTFTGLAKTRLIEIDGDTETRLALKTSPSSTKKVTTLVDDNANHFELGMAAHMAGDMDRAILHLTDAVRVGNVQAMHQLARLYELGVDTTIDREQAAELYREAARQGNRASRIALDRMNDN